MRNVTSIHKKDLRQHTIVSLIKKSSSSLFVYFFVSTMIILPSTWMLINANAQTDKDPAFQDFYWTDNNTVASSNTSINDPIKKEVGPGEGAATLAIVLVNKARSDITAVKGNLTLPPGFKTIGKIPQDMGNNSSDPSPQYSVDSYNSIVKSGETFTLYFDMNVLNNANVGSYTALLDLLYSKVLETGQIAVKNIEIPFRVTGKVVLDVTSENHHLNPGSSNAVKITIKNKGSANASGVIVSVNGATGTSNSISSNNSSSITANGGGGGVGTESISLANVGNSTFNIGIIPTNGTAEINPLVYPSNSAAETVQNLPLHISYGDAYGNIKSSDQSVGLIISAKPPESILNVNPDVSSNNENSSILLMAGKIQKMRFTVANEGKKPVTDLLITLASQADTVKILGNSKWMSDNLMPRSKLNLSTNVFASEEVIGKAIEFAVKIQYVSEEQSRIETINLGSYVDGQITVRVYDLDINIIGNRPNLVGNLLNEGNTGALFTTVEMIKPPFSGEKSLVENYPSPQYLGDLTENSPLPFSIPLTIENSTKAGIYPVFLKVSYRDNLRILHELTIKGSVHFEPMEQTIRGGQSIFGININNNDIRNTTSIISILIIAVIGIIIWTIVLRKRRSKSKLIKMIGNDKNNIKMEEEKGELNSVLEGPDNKKNDRIINERKRGYHNKLFSAIKRRIFG
jgi:hypothetical protein